MNFTNKDKKALILEISRAIERYSSFSKWWSSVNLITLSGFFAFFAFLLDNISFLSFKIILLVMYLITIILCNLMAVNYLSMEKHFRKMYDIVQNPELNEKESDILKKVWKPKIRLHFKSALKSWAILIPLSIYSLYFIALALLIFVY